MSRELSQIVFALFCVLGMVAIAFGALLEIARARRAKEEGSSFVSPRQFRLRLMSAFIWIILLGSLAYATATLWPEPGDFVTARKFVSLISGAFLLLPIALVLLFIDVVLTRRARLKHESDFHHRAENLVREELERARKP